MTGQPTEVKRLPKFSCARSCRRRSADKSRIYARDLPAELRDAVWQIVPGRPGTAARVWTAGLDPAAVPALVLPDQRESRRDPGGASERLGDTLFAVELRNASWFNEKNVERTLRFLTDNELPFVMVDEPQGYKSSVPPLVAVTSPEPGDHALPRPTDRDVGGEEHHTRRTVSATCTTATSCHDWAPRLRDAGKQTRDLHVLMNNCYANYGSTNARELARILADLKPD